MQEIEVLNHHIVYDNPVPHLRSRHGYFPGAVRVPGADLVCLFVLGEAFEAADRETVVTRSRDLGRTWTRPTPLGAIPACQGFLKPTVLADGSLVALGYGFRRDDPEMEANPVTGGMPPGRNLVAFSNDEGRTWTAPEPLPLRRPEVIETSGPCIELSNGELLATGATFKMWDGTTPSGNVGVVLRSRDRGRTWSDDALFFASDNVCAYETRSCEMQPGRIATLIWMFDEHAGTSLTNHVVVSHDNGRTWSEPIDTGIAAQASNLLHVGGDRLLTVHCHREQDPTGLFVRLVDFADDTWTVLSEQKIWSGAAAQSVTSLLDMGRNLKFGQPSLLDLGNGEILVFHWAVEEGQGRILAHRIACPH